MRKKKIVAEAVHSSSDAYSEETPSKQGCLPLNSYHVSSPLQNACLTTLASSSEDVDNFKHENNATLLDANELKNHQKSNHPISPVCTSSIVTSMKDKPNAGSGQEKGVVYLARVPPFMNVTKLRQYLQNFGVVERIYLTPESSVQRKNRLRAGGSKKEMFQDGWIEFRDKKVAKFVGRHLNNTPVGGSKRHNFWRDDTWNFRYLSKFQWHHLLDYHTGKKKAREARRTADLLQVRRENAHYLDQVERKRKHDVITKDREARKIKKLQKAFDDS